VILYRKGRIPIEYPECELGTQLDVQALGMRGISTTTNYSQYYNTLKNPDIIGGGVPMSVAMAGFGFG